MLRSPSGGRTAAAAAIVSQGYDDHDIHQMNLLRRERFFLKASELALIDDEGVTPARCRKRCFIEVFTIRIRFIACCVFTDEEFASV